MKIKVMSGAAINQGSLLQYFVVQNIIVLQILQYNKLLLLIATLFLEFAYLELFNRYFIIKNVPFPQICINTLKIRESEAKRSRLQQWQEIITKVNFHWNLDIVEDWMLLKTSPNIFKITEREKWQILVRNVQEKGRM